MIMIDQMKTFLEIIIIFFAVINLLMTRFALMRLHQPTTLSLWVIKVFISALSPILFLIGIITAILGLILNSFAVIAIGSCSASLYLIHIIKISSASDAPNSFEQAFGAQWQDRITEERKAFLLPKRYVLRLPNSPGTILNQNISFYTIPGTNRNLLCDIWQPP